MDGVLGHGALALRLFAGRDRLEAMPSTVDTVLHADELKLTMDNEGRIYDRLQTLRSSTVRVACLVGKYDVEAASKVFDSIVEQEAKRYTNEWGTSFTKAEKRHVAREYAREVKYEVNQCVTKGRCVDLPKDAQATLKSCKVPATGFAGAKRRKRR